jgi:hypothetical protein
MIESPRVTRRAAMAALAVAGVGMACRATPVAIAPGLSLDEAAERYVRLALALAQHQPSLVEQWLGAESWRPGPRRPVAALRREVEDLHGILATTVSDAAPERVEYLRLQVAALVIAARRLSGDALSFVDEARASLGADVGAFVDRLADIARSEPVESGRADLERRLPGGGPLHERYAAFRTRHAIAPARLGAVIAAAVDRCRVRVRARLALPEAEGVQLESSGEAGLEGRARYDGRFRSRVWIAASGPIDLARLVWLVAHESYPGHHVQHVLGDREAVLAHGWHERLLHPSFGRHLLCAEGAAEAGAALLVEDAGFENLCGALASQAGARAADIDAIVAVHRLVTMLDLAIAVAACAYLDGEMGSEAAAAALTEQALVPDALRMLQVIERQRTRILAYPIGRRLVSGAVAAAPAADRWQRLAGIATTLTLPGSSAAHATADRRR